MFSITRLADMDNLTRFPLFHLSPTDRFFGNLRLGSLILNCKDGAEYFIIIDCDYVDKCSNWPENLKAFILITIYNCINNTYTSHFCILKSRKIFMKIVYKNSKVTNVLILFLTIYKAVTLPTVL